MAVSHKKRAKIADFRFFKQIREKNRKDIGATGKTEDLHMEIFASRIIKQWQTVERI